MTDFEKYVYNRRKNEFFETIYNGNSIGYLSFYEYSTRTQYQSMGLFVIDNGFTIGKKVNDTLFNKRCVCDNITAKDVDAMAHFYAIGSMEELKNFMETKIKNFTKDKDCSLTFEFSSLPSCAFNNLKAMSSIVPLFTKEDSELDLEDGYDLDL